MRLNRRSLLAALILMPTPAFADLKLLLLGTNTNTSLCGVAWIDDNGVTSFIDDLGVTCFTDDLH